MSNLDWYSLAEEIKAISQNGLAYCNNPYEKERYLLLQQIAAKIIAKGSELSIDHITNIFSQDTGYCTPKLDVRGAVFRDDKILLVQESADQLWTLPGGWVDINESASEAVVREIREESGYITQTLKLAALWDKHKHAHPPQIPHAYKIAFICELLGGEPNITHEILNVGWFEKNNLPALSLDRITKAQIERLYEHYYNQEMATDFD